MPNKKAVETVFKVGDQVKLKTGAKRVEVNDFDRMPQEYYFEAEDVAIVLAVDSPRLRHKPGFDDTQTVVTFEKLGARGLVARVETENLQPIG